MAEKVHLFTAQILKTYFELRQMHFELREVKFMR